MVGNEIKKYYFPEFTEVVEESIDKLRRKTQKLRFDDYDQNNRQILMSGINLLYRQERDSSFFYRLLFS